MKNTSFTENANNLEMVCTIVIPKVGSGSITDIDKAKSNRFALMRDIVGAFSPRIIESLERRMSACQRLLISHLEDIEYNDGFHICWTKNGRSGYFNVPSFTEMQSAVKALKMSCFHEFIANKIWIDQTLKALLNDTEQDHSDMGGFRYSQLVSILCELQACPPEYMPK